MVALDVVVVIGPAVAIAAPALATVKWSPCLGKIEDPMSMKVYNDPHQHISAIIIYSFQILNISWGWHFIKYHCYQLSFALIR
jgi:hypothetical protein